MLSIRELGFSAIRNSSSALRVTKSRKSDKEINEWEGLYLVGWDEGVKIME